MKTTICLSLCAAAGLACALAAAPSGPVSGKLLVLENERTLEGDIDLAGDVYRIRRQSGEATVPAAKVLRLCASLEEAYEFVRARANLGDADERLRLAQWCHLRGLKAQALAE